MADTPGAASEGERSGWFGSRWLRLVIGIVLVIVGAALVVRPFASLATLIGLVVVALVVHGVGELLGSRRRGWSRVAGVAYLLSAAVILIWPTVTIRLLAVLVAAALVVGGLADLTAASRTKGTARYNALIGGLGSVLFGVLLLAWPDINVLVVGILFGARLLMAGGRQLVAFRRGDDVPILRRPGDYANPKSGWLRLTGTSAGALLAVALGVLSFALHRGSPGADAFYAAPESVPSAPGQLLRSEPFTSGEIPEGARAWRILYTTTRDEGEPALASGLVIAPAVATGPSPVIAWSHGTTGFAQGCAPSILEDGLAAGAMMIQDQVLEQGWALVATDYTGLGTEGPHPYLIGQGEGRSVLDAIRAAQQLREADLAVDTVVWGHSQGGHAALWAGQLESEYAPELEIAGIAALAPAGNLPGLVDQLGSMTGGDIFGSFVISAYAATYPDVAVADHLRPAARIIVPELAARCLAEESTLASVLATLLFDRSIWTGDPTKGAFGARLVENVPSGRIDAPLLLGQGAADGLITPAAQLEYVQDRCRAGFPLDYRTYPGRGHVELIEPNSPLIPELVAWTRDRFAGLPADDTCVPS